MKFSCKCNIQHPGKGYNICWFQLPGYNQSTDWSFWCFGRTFLEISKQNIKNETLVGNIYRPPKDNNSIIHIDTFVEEVEIVLNDIENLNH